MTSLKSLPAWHPTGAALERAWRWHFTSGLYRLTGLVAAFPEEKPISLHSPEQSTSENASTVPFLDSLRNPYPDSDFGSLRALMKTTGLERLFCPFQPVRDSR
jgi:hypothetical protein